MLYNILFQKINTYLFLISPDRTVLTYVLFQLPVATQFLI